MTNLEFQSTQYRTKADMLDAIAYAWWTADGINDPEQVDDLMTITAEEAATEAIDGWGLNRQGDLEGELSHTELNEYTAADLAEAMQDFMLNRPDRD